MKNVLTIAGSDSSGGAGIQADLKTFSAHGVFGMSVITAVTAQNTQGVFAVEDISPELIAKQIESIFEDIRVHAVKIGMVSKIETIKTIAEGLKKYKPDNVVLDPVMVSKSGYHLLKPEAKEALINKLLPLATIVTPNIHEAEVITGIKINSLKDMEKAAYLIKNMGPKYVLVKGGHLEENATDLLFDGNNIETLTTKKINTKNTHGTGCTLSSAIASNLANGYSIHEAVKLSKEYITTAIENSLDIGKGVGPTHHFYTLYKRSGVINE
ncbi:bifunctional hydroxymethylpyrimidine kinase/phosphomethylpyrimidine kinase [Thermohalobacter berrensis]|uniref:Hydroxymethylpyrimidine/phosphomethylpyrimidine kinase n=1 Tax=Thermohalobacter berrensis TaxID=99594 RepID=A0A419T421_9FIRM|nr:bifunctional hydroxymethylpyrimidine kinase/phosphomethylpyrimidine kinase [Thermohalobacter berrensis]RKD32300.1 bifunctional hydroxymethylpyrimidine kinase/phosphomethylpyrimidine kinase [Thermohalobacter berrensis]